MSIDNKTEEIDQNEPTVDQEENRNEDILETVSVGVGRDTTSRISPKQQQATISTVGDECVSYPNDYV